MQMLLLFQLRQPRAKTCIPCQLFLHEYELALSLYLNRRKIASRKYTERSAYYLKLMNLSEKVNVGRKPHSVMVYGAIGGNVWRLGVRPAQP